MVAGDGGVLLLLVQHELDDHAGKQAQHVRTRRSPIFGVDGPARGKMRG